MKKPEALTKCFGLLHILNGVRLCRPYVAYFLQCQKNASLAASHYSSRVPAEPKFHCVQQTRRWEPETRNFNVFCADEVCPEGAF